MKANRRKTETKKVNFKRILDIFSLASLLWQCRFSSIKGRIDYKKFYLILILLRASTQSDLYGDDYSITSLFDDRLSL